MFAMPTKQRLILCRCGFVLCCVLPTLAVCFWIAGQSSASPAVNVPAAWATIPSSYLGLIVECDGSSQGGGGVLRLESVRLVDPETRAILVRAASVDAQPSAAGWQLAARGAAIDTAHLPRLLALLHQPLFGAPSADTPSGTIHARDVIVRTAQSTHTFSSLVARLGADAAGPQATLELTPSDAEPNAVPMRLAIVRDRSGALPVTRWQLDTARQALPCALVGSVLPEAARLGPHAQFTGLVSVSLEPDGLTGELTGTLDRVDLDAVVTERFPHQLSGLARVNIESARLEHGKLTDLRGTLAATGGAISPSLVASAIDHLRLQPASILPADTAVSIPFDNLAISFALDGRFLRLSPMSKSAAVMSDGQGPLLAVAPGHSVPAVNLLRALLPDNEYQVPATRQTDALVGLLPVPDLVLERTASRTTHTPTRLRSSGPAEEAPVLRQPGLR
jgi:hypothetical protein